jgi:hypothetical protein
LNWDFGVSSGTEGAKYSVSDNLGHSEKKGLLWVVLFLLDFEGSHDDDDDDAQLFKCGVRKALNFRKTWGILPTVTFFLRFYGTEPERNKASFENFGGR